MSYFSLRKREPEPDAETADEELVEPGEDEPGEEPSTRRSYGPLVTGILGPGQWIAVRFGTAPAWGVHGAGAWAIGYYGSWIAAGVVTVWLFFVALFIPHEALDRWAAAIEKLGRSGKPAAPAAVEPPKAAPADVRAATIEWVQRQIGDTQGVHLRDLLQHAQQHGMFEGLDVTTFRGHLERWGVPVRRRVRVRGKGITVGIYRDDLKALPPAPSPAPSQDAQKSGLHPA